MKIRAYKLAEELGIDRNEFVEKAKEAGIELRSAMAALEPQEVEALREKLGGARASRSMEEQRVERKGSTAVIRRRRKAVAEPEPVAEAEAEPDASLEEALPDELAADAVSAPPSEADSVSTPADAEATESDEPAADATPTPAVPAEQPAAEKAPQPKVAQPQSPSDRKGRHRKRVREVVNLQEQEQFARQLTSRRGAPRRPAGAVPRATRNPRSRRRDPAAKQPLVPKPAEPQQRVVRLEGDISVGELAKQLGVKAAQLQGQLMALGTMVSVNQSIPVDVVEELATKMSFEVQDVGFKEEAYLEPVPADPEEVDTESSIRSPIVTVMGHVDHGKTSLLDAIRKTKVVDGEAGGITQHIGAYQVETNGATLTFIDTPGHAAFTEMRARGAKVTDIVVLVVAATDGVMPQTVEAIEHAKAAGVPIVVAVNKCDLPNANPAQARQKLMEYDLISEEFGGDVVCVDISAKTGDGLDQLLEMIGLQAELLELTAVSDCRAKGIVLEAELDRGRGPLATALILEGSLKRGDVMVVGQMHGRVRQMEDDSGSRLEEAGPSAPVRVIGLGGVPTAGDSFYVVESERVARQIVGHREEKGRAKPVQAAPPVTLEEFFAQSDGAGQKELPLVLKADVQGTCEAVRDALEKLSTDEVKLKILSAGVGGITENDIMLAKASGAIVVGFHVRPDTASRRAAEQQGVDVRIYRVIMNLVDEVRSAMAGLLPPTLKEQVMGRAEVRDLFTVPRVGTIAGSYVTEGHMRRNGQCRLIRDGVEIYDGRLGSLRRFKDDVREVQNGFECGVGIDGYNDVKVGDVIEVYEVEEQPATL
uniref:Translation initiation factor IF-2 n=1 Tax=uncultured myxobacterium HF0200_01L06 TaxID=723556 RepID=E7C3G5_9BACT|nr:translation initiation factor 2 (IF-2) [uncultured myxobacterium HF0200_01L06]